MTKISYTDWWNDVVALLRGNASILIAVAGALVFLPVLAASLLNTPMEPLPQGATMDDFLARMTDSFAENWLPQLAVLLLTSLGQLIIFIVLLDARRPRVGEAFALAAPLFLPFLATSILVGLMLMAGAFLLIIPALYLIGRTQLSGPSLVAEKLNPLTAIRRSFALTAGQGWRIFFFVFLIFLVALIVQLAVSGTIGSVLNLLAGEAALFSLPKLLLAALDALFSSAFFLLTAALWVALYRRLSAGRGGAPPEAHPTDRAAR